MTLNERERFIYHTTTLMTLQLMRKHKTNMTKNEMMDLISLIKKNRCRKLSDYDINNIYDDIEEEIILSGVVYDMKKERNLK